MTDDAVLADVTTLVRLHRGRLLRAARAEGLGPEEALECVQEAFERVLRTPRYLAVAGSPEEAGHLLSALAHNSARNRRRRHHHARPHHGEPPTVAALEGDWPRVDELIAAAEDHLRLGGCVERLTQVQREVVRLRILDEIPGEDVAALSGLSPGNVAVLLRRAKWALRSCMESPA